jgi:hypothetical protein
MKRNVSPLALSLLVGCFLLQGFWQSFFIFPKWVKNYSPGNGKLVSGGLSPDQMLFALTGFREMIAGILWVRADAFFDSGNYDAILPIIRLVTMLDPNEIDVYATGMWHIGYNFTDEEQRSDRRYIPSALALGEEGAKQNPDTYELFFETGWMWYHKVDDDYDNAVYWFEQAKKRPDMIPARKDLLSMAYQRDGRIQDGLNNYLSLWDDAYKVYKNDSRSFGNHQQVETLTSNIDTMLVRMVQRGWVAETQGRSTKGYDCDPPFDVGFSVKCTVIDPRVIRFEGTWNVLPVGTRIRVVLKDANFPHNELAGMDWNYSKDVNLDPPRDETFMQDQLYVKNRRFNRKVDMSKDPTMYPFTSDKYIAEFFYDPRSAPPHIQDKFSWNGEGMTDKNYMSTTVRPGHKVLYTSLTLTKDQILRRGEWQDKVPVVSTPNYKETGEAKQDADVVLDVPSLRGK